MMSALRAFAVAAIAVPSILLLACGSDAKESEQDCDAIAKEARDEVSRAIDANKTCTTTADCVGIAFSTSCFDSCSQGIAKGGAAAVDAAKASAEKNACERFKAKGCKVIIPPCIPPGLSCTSSRCAT